jgi:hypothetical protein
LIAENPEDEEVNEFNPGLDPTEMPESLKGKNIIALATGVGSSVTGALEANALTSEFVDGDDNVAARQITTGVEKALESAYVGNPRVPVSEREQVSKLGLSDVGGGVLKSPEAILSRMTSALPVLEQRYYSEMAIQNTPGVSKKVQSDAQARAKHLSYAIRDMKAIVASARPSAPEEALQMLNDHKDDPKYLKSFQETFGYLPEGY